MSETNNTTQALLDQYLKQEEMIKSQYANASSELKRQYNQSLGVVDQSRKGSRQAASISLDKLKKYLPEQLAAEGLGNLGMSQTAYVRAQNNYQNQLAGIESDANAKRADLYNSYANNRSALERQKTRDLLDLYSKRDAAIYQAERDAVGDARYEDEQTKADQLAFYNNLAAMIDNGTFDSTEALNAYLNADTNGDGIADVYGNLGDNYKSLIDGKVAGYQGILNQKKQPEQNALFEETMAVMEGGMFNTTAELKEYLYGADADGDGKPDGGGVYDGLADYQKSIVDRMYNFIENDPSQKERDEEANPEKNIKSSEVVFNKNNGVSDFREGDNFSVKIGDKKYYVESDGEVDEAQSKIIKNAATASNIGQDQVFGFNDQLYIIHQGKVYGIRKRSGGYKKNFNDLYNEVFYEHDPQKKDVEAIAEVADSIANKYENRPGKWKYH